jgi:AAHS family 4-hydroxybenzoate transporter-like MFS transporter
MRAEENVLREENVLEDAVDIGALLDDGVWSAYQKLATVLAALAVIFDGCDIQILGIAIPSLIREWHVARAAFAPVVAIGLAGMALGSPAAGYFGDRYGRRPALIGCVGIFGLATIATAFTHGLAAVAILRFITGLGAGGALPNAGALAAELAPLRRRAVAVKLTIVCVPLGGMAAGLMAAWILPAHGWRALYALGGAAPLLLAAVLWMGLPESPRFLVRRRDSWPRLGRLLNRMGRRVRPGALFQDSAEPRSARGNYLRALLAPGLRRDTSGLWIAFFFCLGSIYLVFGWLPAMLAAQTFSVAATSSGLAAYNFGGVLGVLLWTGLITAFGSRGPMLFGSLAAVASALAILAIPAGSGANLLIWGIGVNGLFANAVQTSMFALAAHIYPASVRASGVAYAAAVGRTGAVLISLAGAAIIQAGGAAYWCAIAAAMLCACAGLAWVHNHIPATAR